MHGIDMGLDMFIDMDIGIDIDTRTYIDINTIKYIGIDIGGTEFSSDAANRLFPNLCMTDTAVCQLLKKWNGDKLTPSHTITS